MKLDTRITSLAAALGLLAVLSAGCSHKAAEEATPAPAVATAQKPAASFQEEAKRIQDDPSLPQAVKDARIQAARDRFGPTNAVQR